MNIAHTVFLAIAAVVQVPADTPIVFTNVNVVPMDREQVVAKQSVVIEGGIITRIGAAASIAIPRGALTVDGTGKYLMPGLVDVHVHLASNPENEQQQILKLFLVNGVTTVVNLRGTPQILVLKDGVSAGRITGPRIYTSGRGSHKMEFKADFKDVRIFADSIEVEDVARFRAMQPMVFSKSTWSADYFGADQARTGIFQCTADWFAPQGDSWPTIRIEVTSVEKPDKPYVFNLPAATVKRVWTDFGAYRNANP